MIYHSESIFSKQIKLECSSDKIYFKKVGIGSLFKNVKLYFTYKTLLYEVDLSRRDIIRVFLNNEDKTILQEIKLDFKGDQIESEFYNIIIEESFHKTNVKVYYKNEKIFVLSGRNDFLATFKKSYRNRIGEETSNFLFERDLFVLLYCIIWVDYGYHSEI